LVTGGTATRWGIGVLAIGFLTAFSPHVWSSGWPAFQMGVVALELWTVFPFLLLAGLVGTPVLSRPAALFGLALAIAGTLDAQSVVDDDAQGALALIFLPIPLTVAILLLWGTDALVRPVVSRLRHR
jgi:hypothetical protein